MSFMDTSYLLTEEPSQPSIQEVINKNGSYDKSSSDASLPWDMIYAYTIIMI